MKQTIKKLGYAIFLIIAAYIIISDATIIYLQLLGVPLIFYNPLIDKTIFELTIIPQILRLTFIILTTTIISIKSYKTLFKNK